MVPSLRTGKGDVQQMVEALAELYVQGVTPDFEAFDRPDANASCPRRGRSTTAPQSLMLLNSEFSDARARDLTAILNTRESVDEKIRLAFVLTVCREPAAAEIERCAR